MDQQDMGLNFLDFLKRAEHLKNTLRSAHTSTGREESAAEHSWRLGLMAMLLAGEAPELDPLKLLELALIHDLPEALCGDLPAVDAAGRDKSPEEDAAMEELSSSLPGPQREKLLALWAEYQSLATPEARFIKGLDKLETIAQHNVGQNPRDFDYAFNLDYGREYTAAHPLLTALRGLLDEDTLRRMRKSEK